MTPALVVCAPLPCEWETADGRNAHLLVISDQCTPERAAWLADKYAPGAVWVPMEARTA